GCERDVIELADVRIIARLVEDTHNHGVASGRTEVRDDRGVETLNCDQVVRLCWGNTRRTCVADGCVGTRCVSLHCVGEDVTRGEVVGRWNAWHTVCGVVNGVDNRHTEPSCKVLISLIEVASVVERARALQVSRGDRVTMRRWSGDCVGAASQIRSACGCGLTLGRTTGHAENLPTINRFA